MRPSSAILLVLPFVLAAFTMPLDDGNGSSSASSSSRVSSSSSSSLSSSSSSMPEQYVSAECRLSGCGGTVCIGAGEEDVVTTCEWKDSYACYGSARCEKQADGRCGWTMTAELSACLMDPPRS